MTETTNILQLKNGIQANSITLSTFIWNQVSLFILHDLAEAVEESIVVSMLSSWALACKIDFESALNSHCFTWHKLNILSWSSIKKTPH